MRQSLNYQHLFYFWMVAREGRMASAARELKLASATLSVQIRQLEEQYGQPLFRRSGRRLELTDVGRTALRYAETIFSVGRELEDFLRGRPTGGPLRLDVGVAPVLPKLVTWRLLTPIRELATQCHLVCHEAAHEELIERLVLHQVDVILSDGPLHGTPSARLFNHHLGDSNVCIMGTPELAGSVRDGFPQSLTGMPLLLPKSGTAMRRNLDSWMATHGINPRIVAEFHDSALLKVAGAHGDGLMPVPEIVADEAAQHFGVERIGFVQGCVESYYAVSAERQIAHPAVKAITAAAKELLGGTRT